jgi:very-short-patch-repair endonuclease
MAAEGRKAIHSGSKSDSRRGELYLAAAALASGQHEVLKLEHLCGLGMSASGVRHWVAAGHIHRQYAGVYAFGRPDLSPQGHRLAAIFACGDGALCSFVTAGATHEIRATMSSYIDVTIPAGAPLRRHRGIRCHRADLLPQDAAVVDGIPVTSVSRTLLDLATVLSEDALERAAKQAVVERVFDMRAIEDLLVRSKGHRGIRKLRSVLERGDLSAEDQPKSGLEIAFAELCRTAGLPKPEINRYLLLGDEYHEIDFLWRSERVVIETDGGRYHSDGWQKARDAKRDMLLTKHGFRHERIPDLMVEHQPREAIAIARTLLGR